MRVWSNIEATKIILAVCGKAKAAQQYAEIQLNHSHIMDHGRPAVGYTLSAKVFNQGEFFTALVDLDLIYTENQHYQAVAKAEELAKKFDLQEDTGLKIRRAVWGV